LSVLPQDKAKIFCKTIAVIEIRTWDLACKQAS